MFAPRGLLLFGLLTSLSAQGTTDSLAVKVDELCAPFVQGDLTVGLVVGVIDGDRTFVRGQGVVARGGAVAPDGDTLYEIGSNSKVFTGLLLADAVQRGVVKLDDPVQKYLPEGVVMPKWEETPVLVWHLSTHTSGLPRLPDMKGSDAADPYAHFTTARLHAALGKARVRWEPGSKYEYSNFAVGLLGELLARTQGMSSYEALLQARVTGPLGMKDTSVRLDDAHLARMAPPYDSEGEPAHLWDLAALAGAGGIRSSMNDMLRFARLQVDPGSSQLASAVNLQQQKRYEEKGAATMGLGWHFTGDGLGVWHNGQTGGYHSYLVVERESHRAVCILTNTSRDEVDALGGQILRHLHGKPTKARVVEMPVRVDPAQLARLVGDYRVGRDAALVVTLRERGLFAQLSGQQALALVARSATEFDYRVVKASLTFEVDGELVKAVVLHQNGKDQRFPRASIDK
jgi:serine-type D-Ala-D-Ala carboxypeptidase/endopeptidase